MTQNSNNWTLEVWARIYKFPRGKGEGCVGRHDGFHAGKLWTNTHLKDGFQPGSYQNPKEHKVLEFILPILSPGKPRRISLTMANTLYRAMFGVRPVNWGK